MPSQYSNLVKRILSSLFAIPIILIAIYWSMWSYFLLFFFIMVFCMLEFYKLVGIKGVLPQRFLGIFIGGLAYMIVFIRCIGWIRIDYLYLLGPMIALMYCMELYRKTVSPFTNIAYTLLGIIYVSVPFSLLHMIAFHQGGYHYALVIGILLLLWTNDTGAYLIGSSMGKRKLFQRISPKKSWEGSMGGALLTLLVGYLLAGYFHSINVWEWLAIGSTVIIAGTYGDLIESMLKRSIHCKDSGALIPGHGGMMDRFDSFLLVIPCIVVLIKLMF